MANMFDRLVKNAGLLKEGEEPQDSRFDYYDITLLTHFLPALINDDWTGFSYDDENGEEEAALKKFIGKLPPGGWWDYEHDDEGYFGRDAVTGLRGQVIDVKYYFPKQQAPMGEDEPSVPNAQPAPGAPLGEDKPKPAPKPKKRPNDDNIAGMYKELTRQMWDNAEKSMKKPTPPAK